MKKKDIPLYLPDPNPYFDLRPSPQPRMVSPDGMTETLVVGGLGPMMLRARPDGALYCAIKVFVRPE